MKHEAPQEEKKSKKKRLLILLLCLLLVAGSYGVYHFFLNKPKENVSVISGDFLPKNKDAKKCLIKKLLNLPKKRLMPVNST